MRVSRESTAGGMMACLATPGFQSTQWHLSGAVFCNTTERQALEQAKPDRKSTLVNVHGLC